MAIAYRSVSPEWLVENGGNFTPVKGAVLRGRKVENREIDPSISAIPLIVINEKPDFNIGSHLYLGIEGNDPLEYVEVGEDVPFSSMSAMSVYFVNVGMLHNDAIQGDKSKTNK